MRVIYEWTQAEWNEAVQLATEKARRRGSVPGMVYALVGIPLFGAILDGATAIRTSGTLRRDHATVPLLLLVLAAAMAVGVAISWWWKRHQRLTTQAPMPGGQWEIVLQEAGWSVSPMHAPKAASAIDVPAETEPRQHPEASHDAPPQEAASAANAPDLKQAVPAATRAEETHASVAETLPAPAVNLLQTTVAQPETSPSAPATSQPQTNNEIPAETQAAQQDTLAQVQASSVAPEPVSEPAVPTPPVKTQTAATTPALEPWQALSGSRAGDHVIVLLHGTGFHAVPVRCMTPDQASHMHRMVLRKLRPAPAARSVPPGI